jgi:hypothetical protein
LTIETVCKIALKKQSLASETLYERRSFAMEKPVGGEEKADAAPAFPLPHFYPEDDRRPQRSRGLLTILFLATVLGAIVYYWREAGAPGEKNFRTNSISSVRGDGGSAASKRAP